MINRFRDQPQEGTPYDLFNLITATAKRHSDWVISDRLSRPTPLILVPFKNSDALGSLVQFDAEDRLAAGGEP
jgi:hypothetical protein